MTDGTAVSSKEAVRIKIFDECDDELVQLKKIHELRDLLDYFQKVVEYNLCSPDKFESLVIVTVEKTGLTGITPRDLHKKMSRLSGLSSDDVRVRIQSMAKLGKLRFVIGREGKIGAPTKRYYAI